MSNNNNNNNNNDTDTKSLLKYQKKIDKLMKKMNEVTSNNDNNENKKMDKLIKKKLKYENKLIKLNETLNMNSNNDNNNNKVIDKSGLTLLLFYAYVEPPWSHARHLETINWANETLSKLNCTGRLRISREGFNGTLTGSYDNMRQFTSLMRTYDNNRFSHMTDIDDFKLKDHLPLGQKFPKLKVFSVKELVNYGIGIDNAPSVFKGGIHLDPVDYHNKLQEGNSVVIDVRNSYEADIGRFKPNDTGAEYIDPKMRISTEFPAWAKENFDKIKDKQVLMYCTGGIRCERASALIRSLGHENVYQLKGGIHNYLEYYADKGGGCWIGENYTFDKRFAHGATHELTIENKDNSNNNNNNNNNVATTAAAEKNKIIEKNTLIIGKCCGCGVSWNKYRGKKRCLSCGVPLLLCHACIKNDADKKGAKCQLCQEDIKLGRPTFNKRMAKDGLIRSSFGSETGGDEDYDENDDNNNSIKDAYAVGNKYKRKQINECGVCHEQFKTRNALFRHIQDFNHMNRKRQRKDKSNDNNNNNDTNSSNKILKTI